MASIRKYADKETVQTTNTKEAAKAVVVRITDWSLVQVQVPPPNKNKLHWSLFLFEVVEDLNPWVESAQGG